MHSSKRKDLIGTTKVGRCMGNLYCPYDDFPFKLPAAGQRNTSNFQNVDGCKICFSCGHDANRKWCGAQTMLTIYHIGAPKCLLKPNKKK